MNTYRLDELQIGLTEQFQVQITQEMMDSFQKITGDVNPMHCDAVFAVQHGFPMQIVYGMLTTSFLSTLAGVYLPGKYSLIHEVKIYFIKPVFIDGNLTIIGKVTEIEKRFGYFIMLVEIWNEQNKKVVKAKMKVGVVDE